MARNPDTGRTKIITISIDRDQWAAVADMADDRRGNRSAIVREAIDMYLRVHGRDPRQPVRDGETAAVA